MYRDITTYNRNEKERKPRVLQNESNGIKFTVHKHFAYGEEWLLTCRELGVELMDLHTEDMEEAKENAIYKMIELLGKAAQKYNKAIVELSI